MRGLVCRTSGARGLDPVLVGGQALIRELNPKFNKHCANCEFYNTKLGDKIETWPYYSHPTWKAKLFNGPNHLADFLLGGLVTLSNIENLWRPGPGFKIWIYGPTYRAGYSFRTSMDWVLTEKVLRNADR